MGNCGVFLYRNKKSSLFYWLGVSIAPTVMCLLSAGQHIWEMVALGNYSSNNLWAGGVDLIGPLTLLILFEWYFMLTRKECSGQGLTYVWFKDPLSLKTYLSVFCSSNGGCKDTNEKRVHIVSKKDVAPRP